jgi:hypothetical protein
MISILSGFIPIRLDNFPSENQNSSLAEIGEPPNEPGKPVSVIEDQSSLETAEAKTTYEDILYLNLLERPFSPGKMNYIGFVDISLAELSMDNQWVYVTINVEEALPFEPVCDYGVEVDTDLDDRGDFLVWANLPMPMEWIPLTKVYIDGNKDVGGLKPYLAEPPEKEWDGYETEIPDVEAWIRRAPEDDQQVWIAFPIDFLHGADTFVWSVYAQCFTPKPPQSSLVRVSANQQQPKGLIFDQSKFHYNDFVHPKRAGSPIEGSRFYPLGDLAFVDNTCRQIYGATLEAPYPGFCDYEIQGIVAPGETEVVPVPDQPDDDDDLPDPDDSPPDDVIFPPEDDECQDTVAAPCDDDDTGQYPERGPTVVVGEGDDDDGDDDDGDEDGGLKVIDWNPTEHILDNLNIIKDDD